MKRPMLLSGIVFTIALAFITSIPESAAVILTLGASALLLCLIRKLRKHIIIPAIGICLILSVIFSFYFYKSKIESCIPYHNTTHNIQGKVISLPETDYYGISHITIKTTEIDGKDVELNIDIAVSPEELSDIELYDNVYINKAHLVVPTDEKLDYDFSPITDGTLLEGEAEEITYLSDADRTPYYYCLKLRGTVTDRISQTLSDENGAILKGMLFGDKNGMSYETKQAYRNSGIAHLLAVSGLHTALWCGIILAILKALKLKERTSAVICLLFLSGFVIISAFTPSVIRASIMMASLLIAPLFNRKGDPFNTLGLAVFVLLAVNPYNILSVSFQMSAAATLGVFCSFGVQEKIFSKTSRIPLDPLKRLINTILGSICISVFASVFTFPVSAYHFGVFNLLSPIGNLLCVTPAFYGMISGVLGIGFSFIPTPITRGLSFALIDLTEFIINLTSTLARLVAGTPFATIPVHRSYLLVGLLASAIIISIGYLIYTHKFQSKILKSIIAILTLTSLAVSVIVPLTIPPYSTTLTIVSSGNNLHIIIRSGTNYAYISDATESSYNTSDYLPRATSESLKYYIPMYLGGSAMYDLERISNRYSPEEIRLTEFMHERCLTNDIPIPKGTIIKAQDKYVLSDEITFEIIDTYHIKYAIIESNEKTVFVHLSGELDSSALQYMNGCDIIVTNSIVPELIPRDTDTVIISADAKAITDKNISYIYDSSDEAYLTARNGTIQINL